jgi:hypothetical protein
MDIGPHFSQNFAPKEKTVNLTKQKLFIDFRDFMTDISDPSTKLEFTVKLAGASNSLNLAPYDHVTEVELLGISFPKIDNEVYFIINIPEFDCNLHSSDNKGSNFSFATIYYDSTSMTKGVVKPAKGRDFMQKIQKFNPPLQTLSKFTLQFKKYGGDVLTLADIDPASLKYCNLILEFTIRE